MFTLADPTPYPWPVTVHMPSAETPGAFDEQTFTARFKHIDADDIPDLTERAAGDDAVLLRDVLVGWDTDIVDAAGKPIPYSTATRDRLINILHVRYGLVAAWRDSIEPRARAERARGNSPRSPRRGRLDA